MFRFRRESSRLHALWAAPLVLGGALATPGAFAYEAGEMFMRVGPAVVAPNDDSSALRVNGAEVAGTGAEVDEGWAIGFTFNYMMNPHWGVELLASTPFTHDVDAQGLGGLGIDSIGEVEHLPPTLSLQYYPMAPQARFQPYVGLGVNYFLSYSESLSDGFENVLGESDIEVDDSVGLAAQVGMDYAITDRWSVNAALWYIDVDTEATIETPTAGFERIEVDVDVDPLTWMLGVSYRF